MATEKMGPRETALRAEIAALKTRAESFAHGSDAAYVAWGNHNKAESELRVAILKDALDKAIKLLSDATRDEHGFRAREHGQAIADLRAILDEK